MNIYVIFFRKVPENGFNILIGSLIFSPVHIMTERLALRPKNRG